MTRNTMGWLCLAAGVLVLAGWLTCRAADAPTRGWKQYDSAPKGVTLEGVAQGLPAIKSIHFLAKEKRFVINGDISYATDLSGREWSTLLRALKEDDRLGLSITDLRSRSYITFGEVRKRTDLMQALLDTDLFLSDVVFARAKDPKALELPDGYIPTAPEKRTILTVVHFNLTDFVFDVREKDGVKCVTPVSRTLEVNVIPVQKEQKRGGGYLPDLERMAKGDLHPEDMKNAAHMNHHQGWYLAHQRVRKTVAYGEAAALCRLILASEVDTQALLRELR